ncbi:hypothetical protein DQ353_00340 [Arthrobacter sp. AQ5-05]|nr:hypothetical protein DQ353_00340 [Arthrobacter sp. AQ5-05]
MIMKLTDQQGQRLTQMMLAMRPDWIPNKPGTVLIRANESEGFPAADFGHCIRALAAYATETNADGTPAKRTPNVYPEHGRHWTTTAPDGHEAPKARPCGDHDTEPAHNCRSCRADVLAGDRTESMIGKRTTPTVTPGRSPRPNRVRADPALVNPPHPVTGGDLPDEKDPGRAIPHPTPPEASG